MNKFKYIEEQERNQKTFAEGFKNEKITIYTDALLQEMSIFDYLSVPFVVFATNKTYKDMYFDDILIVMAYLLTKYGKVTIVKNNKNHSLILLEQDNNKYVYDVNNGLVYDYDIYITLETTTLKEIMTASDIKHQVEASVNISYDYPKSTRRILLTDLAISNYKLGNNKVDFQFMRILSDYLLNSPDNTKGPKFKLEK